MQKPHTIVFIFHVTVHQCNELHASRTGSFTLLLSEPNNYSLLMSDWWYLQSRDLFLPQSWQTDWYLHSKKDNISVKSVQLCCWMKAISFYQESTFSILAVIWKVQSFSQNSKNCQSLCSESPSQLAHYTEGARVLMITAFQFWLSASGKTNRARAGVWQLVGYSLQTQHRKKPWMWWLLYTPQKEWIGSNEALRLLHRDTCRHLISDITGNWCWSATDS